MSGGSCGPSVEGLAPSRPATRMLRSASFITRWAISGLSSFAADRSRTIGRPMKKSGERSSHASSFASQSATGSSGVNKKAM